MLTEVQIRKAIQSSGVNCDVENLKSDTVFADAGLDSLDTYNIIIEIQEQSGVEVPDEDIEQLQSISAIEKYFSDR